MDSLLLPGALVLSRISPSVIRSSNLRRSSPPLALLHGSASRSSRPLFCRRFLNLSPDRSRIGASGTNSMMPSNDFYTVGDFMTRKEDLHVVKTTTTVDEALQMLVENRITGFPVIEDDWTLVGLVSDYDLLALDSISGRADTSLFPEVDRTWKTFNEIQKLLSKTSGKVIGDLMTPSPVVVVRETTHLEDAARILLETKYRRLPVVDSAEKLVGIITRGNVVRAALEIKRECERGDFPSVQTNLLHERYRTCS